MELIEKIENFELVNQMDIFDNIIMLIGTLFWVFIALVFIRMGCYLIKALTLYSLAKKSNAKTPILAFIPILQNAKIFNLAGFTDLTFYVILLVFFLAYCIPAKEIAVLIAIAQLVVTMYIRVRVAKSFGGGLVEQILTCLFEPIMLIYFALANKPYEPSPIHDKIYEILQNFTIEDNVLDKKLIKPKKKPDVINVDISDDKK